VLGDRKENIMELATLEAHEVFRFLRPDQVLTISDTAQRVPFAEGETVYRQGEAARYLYVVVDGQVLLWLPGKKGIKVLVEELGEGAMFGSCVCLDMDSYTLTAQCTEDSNLVRVDAKVLKKLMDDDLPMGYALQKQISKTYFKRYIDAMRKLQSMVLNLPLEAD
jgi:CRP-like cAMP-binding protein